MLYILPYSYCTFDLFILHSFCGNFYIVIYCGLYCFGNSIFTWSPAYSYVCCVIILKVFNWPNRFELCLIGPIWSVVVWYNEISIVQEIYSLILVISGYVYILIWFRTSGHTWSQLTSSQPLLWFYSVITFINVQVYTCLYI